MLDFLAKYFRFPAAFVLSFIVSAVFFLAIPVLNTLFFGKGTASQKELETVTEVEAEEKNDSKSDEGIKPEAAVSQNTVINGFTFEQMMERGHGGRKHGEIGIEAYHFRKSHQLPGSRPAQYVIPVGELRTVQFVQARFIMQADEPKACSLQTIGHKKSRLNS